MAGHNKNNLRTNSSNNFELSKKRNRSCGDATHTSSGVYNEFSYRLDVIHYAGRRRIEHL